MQCSRCKKRKSSRQFYKHHTDCKDCFNGAARVRYRSKSLAWQKRGERVPRTREQARQAHREKKKAVVNKIKAGTPCADCGLRYPCFVMEFDHRDRSSKTNTISALLSCSWSLQRVLDEIAKCDLVCANCHRMRTAVQLGWIKHVAAPAELS